MLQVAQQLADQAFPFADDAVVGAGVSQQLLRHDREGWPADDDRRLRPGADHLHQPFGDGRIAGGAQGIAVVEVAEGEAEIVGGEGGDARRQLPFRFPGYQKIELLRFVAGGREGGGDHREAEGIDRIRLDGDIRGEEQDPFHFSLALLAKERLRRGL